MHFNPEGSRQLGMQVVAKLRQSLSLPSPTPTNAKGIVFEDLNGNGKLDDSDVPLAGIRVSNGLEIVASDVNGRYALPITDDNILFALVGVGDGSGSDWRNFATMTLPCPACFCLVIRFRLATPFRYSRCFVAKQTSIALRPIAVPRRTDLSSWMHG